MSLRKIYIFTLLTTVLISDGVFGSDVKVTWDPNQESDLGGYIVFYGTRSRMYAYNKDAGNVTECTITSLPDSGVYYFSVKAYDRAGNMSSFSDESFVFLSKIVKKPFKLMPNYPNPFNPSTKIPYQLNYDLYVNISIYDIRGRIVKVLVNGIEARGNKEVEWDGTDFNGMTVASGVYICRIVVGDFSQTRTINLIH